MRPSSRYAGAAGAVGGALLAVAFALRSDNSTMAGGLAVLATVLLLPALAIVLTPLVRGARHVREWTERVVRTAVSRASRGYATAILTLVRPALDLSDDMRRPSGTGAGGASLAEDYSLGEPGPSEPVVSEGLIRKQPDQRREIYSSPLRSSGSGAPTDVPAGLTPPQHAVWNALTYSFLPVSDLMRSVRPPMAQATFDQLLGELESLGFAEQLWTSWRRRSSL